MFIQTLYPETQAALEELKKLPEIEKFYLAGGTAAALQLGHRKSVDLDFFCQNSFDPEKLLQRLAEISEFQVRTKLSDTLTGEWRQARVEFFEYPYPLVTDLVDWSGVSLADLKDIGLMKLTAIAAGGIKKDFFDLYEICQQVISLEDLFKLLPTKFKAVKYDVYHLIKGLVYFDDAEKSAMPELLKDIAWQEVKDFFITKARQIKLE